jgi:hypothetical protein
LGSAARAPSLRVILGICLTTEEKHGKTSARVVSRATQADTVQYQNNEQYNAQKKNNNTEQYDVTEQ